MLQLNPNTYFDCISSYATFKRCNNDINALALSSAGLKFTGINDIVSCSKCNCQLQIKNLDLDSKFIDIHEGEFPNCPIVKDLKTRSSYKCSNDQDRLESCQNPNIFSDSKIVNRNQGNDDIDISSSQLNFDLLDNNKNCYDDVDGCFTDELSDMTYFRKRLKTFTKWPLPFIKIEDLASAGLYYLGTGDRVQCAYCQGILKRWSKNDIPKVEHKRNFPNCKFVKDQFTSINENDSTLGGSILDTEVNSNDCEDYYKDSNNRIRSFRGIKINVTAVKLADSGFFFTEFPDTVKCFKCKLKLSHLKNNEDPMQLHVKRSGRKCQFLVKKLGNTMNDILKKLEVSIFGTVNNEAETELSLKEKQQSASASGCNITAVSTINLDDKNLRNIVQSGKILRNSTITIDSYMETEIVKQVQDLGFTRQVIRQFLVKSGQLYSDRETFIEAFLNASNAETAKNENSDNTNNLDEIDSRNVESENENGDNDDDDNKDNSKSESKSKKKKKRRKGGKKNQIKQKLSDGGFHGAQFGNNENEMLNPITEKLLKENEKLLDEKKCAICIDADRNTIFTPCHHLISCWKCCKRLKQCPICNAKIKTYNRVYMP